MNTSEIIYKQKHDATEFHGFCAYDEMLTEKRPAVIVVHDWSGRNDFACAKAQLLAEMGYVGFAVDMYGNKKTGETKEEKSALIAPLLDNRDLIKERMLAAVKAVKAIPQVEESKIAAIGFCFGGLCVLDLARSGEAVTGVISFHGLLNPPADNTTNNKKISAKVLALHGYDDPMVTPDQVRQFAEEMTAAQVDWQVHMYGQTKHAFTNPLANDPSFGTVYSPSANHRAWQTAENFLEEIFNP